MRWLAVLFIILQTATCGQKGPLTLPERPPAASDTAPAPTALAATALAATALAAI